MGNIEYQTKRNKLIPLAEGIVKKALKNYEHDVSYRARWNKLFSRVMDKLAQIDGITDNDGCWKKL